MLGASLYIVLCSARNRTRLRLRRLREPRYLAGAVVGIAYLYFSFFARVLGTRPEVRARRNRRGGPSLPPLPGLIAVAPAFGGIGLLFIGALSWLMPFESGLLEFSAAETQFLFPAPVTRRQLLMHRLMQSQLGLLFAALIFGITIPSPSGGRRVWLGVAMWVLFVTWKIYFAGVSLTRARIRGASGAARLRAFVAPAVVVTAAVIVAAGLLRDFLAAPPSNLADIVRLVGDVSLQPLTRISLWPFAALVRPVVFARSGGPYLAALGAAVAVLAAATLWMFRSDETFHDAADEAARLRSRQAPGQRAVTYRTRAEGWTLAPTGRPEAAFAWKALMQTLRVFDQRELLRMIIILLTLTLMTASIGRSGPAAMLGGFAIAAALFAVLMAPQIVRIDMRQDLQHLELLKTWPVRASSVVRGEIIWPSVLITAIAWAMMAIALTLSGAVVPRVGFVWRGSVGVAAAILAPALVAAQLTVHNAVALIFPAWVPLGHQRARGLDAMGQRIIMLGATWLMLIVMALPGAIAAGIFWFAAARFAGPVALVPAAAIATGVIAVEVLFATEALGPIYERLDVLAVERAE
jgi:hypothetical protein